jgi:hypothetical protein
MADITQRDANIRFPFAAAAGGRGVHRVAVTGAAQTFALTEVMKGKLMHGPIENGTFAVSIPGYQPQLLGLTVPEASWRLLHRVHEGILNARTTTVPIIQALYADDAQAVTKHQLRAATIDAQPWIQNTFPYQGKCLLWLQRDFDALDEAERHQVRQMITGTGCEALFEGAA